jgi:hypothetical protein
MKWLHWLREVFLKQLFWDEEDGLVTIPENIKLREVCSTDLWETPKRHGHIVEVEFFLDVEGYHTIRSRYLYMHYKERYQYPGVEVNFSATVDRTPLARFGSELTDLSTVFLPLHSFIGKGRIRWISHSYRALIEHGNPLPEIELVLENSIPRETKVFARKVTLVEKIPGKTWSIIIHDEKENVEIVCAFAHDNSKKGSYLVRECEPA